MRHIDSYYTTDSNGPEEVTLPIWMRFVILLLLATGGFAAIQGLCFIFKAVGL